MQLKRRYDLIPNLVETVKGYAAHERATLDAVVAARGGAMGGASPGGLAARADAEDVVTQTLGRLFAVAEAYPELRANQNFTTLQVELSTTEDKIAYARQFYNSAVQSYNNGRADAAHQPDRGGRRLPRCGTTPGGRRRARARPGPFLARGGWMDPTWSNRGRRGRRLVSRYGTAGS